MLTNLCDEYRDSMISNPELRRKLRPETPFGGKRVLVEQGFYSAFEHGLATLITERIDSVTENGIALSDGSVAEYDVMVFCTGYQTQEALRTISGGVHNERTGKELKRDLWERTNCYAFCGRTVSGFPNYFLIMGPGSGLGHSSMINIIESDCEYIRQIIERFVVMDGHWVSIDVRREVMEQFVAASDEQMEKMVWSDDNVRSWYKNDRQRVAALFAWSTVRYWWMSRKVDWTDYNVNVAKT